MFSITTIASSTTMPVARMIEERQRVDGEAISLVNAKAPISDTGMVIGRNDRAAPGLQEDEDHEHDQRDRFRQRLQASRYRRPRRRVEGDLVMIPGGNWREAASISAETARSTSSVGGGELDHAEPTASTAWKRRSAE